jgi:hypothetical protein
VLVLGTPLNVLAFGMPNVIFSLLAFAVLLSWALPADVRAATELAEAERADARRAPTPAAPRYPRRSPDWPPPTRSDGPRTGSRDGAPRPSTDNPTVPTVHR